MEGREVAEAKRKREEEMQGVRKEEEGEGKKEGLLTEEEERELAELMEDSD